MDFELKDAISIYAAVLSTILGGWSIYREYSKKRGKMKFYYEKKGIEVRKDKFENHHIVSIVNLSETTRVIRKIQVENYLNNDTSYPYEDENTEYPIKLEQYEQYNYKLSAETLENGILSFSLDPNKTLPDHKRTIIKRSTLLKVRITLFDTTGKSYQSKWLELKSKQIGH